MVTCPVPNRAPAPLGTQTRKKCGPCAISRWQRIRSPPSNTPNQSNIQSTNTLSQSAKESFPMSEMGSRPTEGFPPSEPSVVKVTGTEWEHRAAQVGTIAGKLVAIFQRARRQWHQFDPRQAAGEAAETLRRETTVRSEEWRQAAKRRSAELRRQAKAGYERTRARAEQIGRDYPVHVVLVAAAAGFVLGVGLRVWRSRRVA